MTIIEKRLVLTFIRYLSQRKVNRRADNRELVNKHFVKWATTNGR